MMEFQAVIMAAGNGSRMREIASGIPKCLLPIGNIPLIMCSLNTLKKAGFSEVIIVVQDNERAKIQSAVEGKVDMKLDIVPIPKNVDWGTADSLRHIKDRLKSSAIVISCDIIMDFDLRNLIDLHRTRDSSLTVLLFPFMKSLKESDTPGYKKQHKFERDIIGLDEYKRLIFINSEADFEENVPFKLSILKQNPQMKVYSNLVDAHVYIIDKDLVNFIVNSQHISALKGEFLPVAVKKQFSYKKSNQKVENGEISLQKDSIDLKALAFELSSYNFPKNYPKPGSRDKIICFSFIEKESFCTRVNTLMAFMDANKKISKNFHLMSDEEPKPHSFPKSQVDADSLIGENCELLTKASVKQSVIGNNCKLAERVKLVGSVIMDNVSFGENCSVQNSIICSNVVIERDCSFKNCIIGPDQTIETLSKLNSEILQGSDHLMEI